MNNFFSKFTKPGGKYYVEYRSLRNTFITCFFTLFPSICVLISDLMLSESVSKKGVYAKYFLQGEFLLYSVALLSSSFMVGELLKDDKKKGRMRYVLPLLLSSVAYAMVNFSRNEVKKHVLVAISIAIILYAAYSYWKIIYEQIKENYKYDNAVEGNAKLSTSDQKTSDMNNKVDDILNDE